jgi:uncharacterized membrane protein (UPF0127 family)
MAVVNHRSTVTPKSPRTFCAFNVTRQAFINLGVSVADTTLTRLRGLLGRMRLRTNEGLWMVPSRGIHTFGLMFPVDLIYLDQDLRVVHLVENLGPLRIAPLRMNSASILELPARSIYQSGTQVGDQLMIRTPQDMERYWMSQETETNLGRLKSAI